jgi:signal transduction histidine kinase
VRLKSLYVATLVAMIGILSLSFVVFQAIGSRVQKISIDPTFDRMDELQLESARDVYVSGGQKALNAYMTTLNRIFRGSHYLLDGRGRDLVSGEDRADLLPRPPTTQWRIRAHERWVIAHRSADGQFWFAAEGPLDRPRIWTFLPYYFLVIGATGLLCWVAAVGVVSPIRRIASTIALFGQGDLSVRVKTDRPDEIGQLGRSFNQMADRLERLIVNERRLLGDISHELRSPLARLKFAIKLARTSPDTKAALDRVERDIDRITSLVSDIVEISFVEGDPALQGAENVLLAEIVAVVVRDSAVEAQLRGCAIELEGAISGEVLGSRELLRRAVENVVRNGIRYAPRGSVVHVSMQEDEHNAMITIRDCGPGVPEEMLTRIFDPFFRVEAARNTNGGGSGLGLSIAKRAIELHYGAITARNASPGLCVEMTIPRVTAAVASREL